MKDHYPTQIVTQSTWSPTTTSTHDPQGAVDSIMGSISLLQTENAELQAKIEGYEKYIKILEGQIKIVENIILKNIK